MYENDMIEMEDFNFNHYIHHFDNDEEQIHYCVEYQCLEVVTECMEEYIYDSIYKHSREF